LDLSLVCLSSANKVFPRGICNSHIFLALHWRKMNAASSYDLGVVEALKVTYPDFLQNHITAIQWSHLHLAEPHESTGDQSLIEFVK
jgi:hypothetical protein